MAVQIQLRGDTAANWTSADPTLAVREVGLETDTGKLKIGDGATAWSGLSYFTGSGIASLVEDTTPQLGGDLDLNGNVITGLVIGTNVQAYDADTAKLDVAQNWSAAQNMQDNELTRPKLKDYGEAVNAIGSIGGGTQDIDLTLGNVVTGTVDTSETTFTFSNPPASGTYGGFVLHLTNGGSQTVNWPASVDWAGGTAPTLTAAGVDRLAFDTLDGGTTWFGFAAGLDMQ